MKFCFACASGLQDHRNRISSALGHCLFVPRCVLLCILFPPNISHLPSFPTPVTLFFLPFIFLSFSFNLLLFFVFPSLHSFLEICYDRLKITMSSLKSVQFVITISFTIIINITINIIIIRTRGPATSELSTPVRPHAFSHARTHSSSFSLSLSHAHLIVYHQFLSYSHSLAFSPSLFPSPWLSTSSHRNET